MQRLVTRRTFVAASAGLGIAAFATSSYYLRKPELLDDGARKRTFMWPWNFHKLTLESVEEVNHNVKRLRFALPQNDAVSGLILASALMSFSWPSGALTPVIRPYSPISAASAVGYVDLLVKHYPSGKVSSHIHSLVPGDKLYCSGPWISYAWKPNAFKNIALIAGGTGITPCFQLIKGILENPKDKTAILLVVGNRSPRDVLLKGELEKLERESGGRLRVVHTVGEGDGSGEEEAKEEGFRSGRITKALLEELLPQEKFGRDGKIFVCGPPQMEDAIAGNNAYFWGATRGMLKELGYDKKMIHRFSEGLENAR